MKKQKNKIAIESVKDWHGSEGDGFKLQTFKDIEKEFRESEFVKREYGEDNDFIDMIAEGTTAKGIESFWLNKIDQIIDDMIGTLDKLLKPLIYGDFTKEQLEEVNREITTYNRAIRKSIQELKEYKKKFNL